MKRLLVAIVLLVLVSAGANAQCTPNIGVFFDTDLNSLVWPAPFETFPAYIYVWGVDLSITAVEFSLDTPDDPLHEYCFHTDVVYPEQTSLYMGDPWNGLSIAYWPPLSCYGDDAVLLCTINLVTTEACTTDGGTLSWYFIDIAEHADTGEMRGTFAPDNEFFPLYACTGYSIICQPPYANEAASWSAVKSLLR